MNDDVRFKRYFVEVHVNKNGSKLLLYSAKNPVKVKVGKERVGN